MFDRFALRKTIMRGSFTNASSGSTISDDDPDGTSSPHLFCSNEDDMNKALTSSTGTVSDSNEMSGVTTFDIMTHDHGKRRGRVNGRFNKCSISCAEWGNVDELSQEEKKIDAPEVDLEELIGSGNEIVGLHQRIVFSGKCRTFIKYSEHSSTQATRMEHKEDSSSERSKSSLISRSTAVGINWDSVIHPVWIASMLDFTEMFKPASSRKLAFWSGLLVFIVFIPKHHIIALIQMFSREHISKIAALAFSTEAIFTTVLSFFASDRLANENHDTTTDQRQRRNKDVAFIITCHKSCKVIETTVKACMKHVEASQIFVIDNGNQLTPPDATDQVLQDTCPPQVHYIWNPMANKTLAQYAGLVAAKDYRYLCLIDDDVTVPENFNFNFELISDRVKAVCYPIRAVHPKRLRTFFIEWQDIEYKMIDCTKRIQSKYSTVLFPHGAISLWDRNTLQTVLRDHDTEFFADDVKMGWWLQRNLYRMHFEPGVLVDTDAPTSICGPSPNFWCQRVRSWDMAEHVYCWDQLKLLLTTRHDTVLGTVVMKIFQLYGVHAIAADWARLCFIIVGVWLPTKRCLAIAGIVLTFNSALVCLWNYVAYRKNPAMRVRYVYLLTFPFYRILSMYLRCFGLLRAFIIYLPNYIPKPKIPEIEANILTSLSDYSSSGSVKGPHTANRVTQERGIDNCGALTLPFTSLSNLLTTEKIPEQVCPVWLTRDALFGHYEPCTERERNTFFLPNLILKIVGTVAMVVTFSQLPISTVPVGYKKTTPLAMIHSQISKAGAEVDPRIISAYDAGVTLQDFQREDGCDFSEYVKRFSPSELQINCANFHDLQVENKLGEGFFRNTYAATWNERPVAVKVVKDSVMQGNALLKRRTIETIIEASVLFSLSDAVNVVQLIGMCNNTVVMERGLEDLSIARNRPMKEILQDARDIARGLTYLHNIEGGPIAYGDLNFFNVMHMADGRAALADMNLIRFTGASWKDSKQCTFQPHHTQAVSKWRSVEEYTRGSKLTEKTDMFTFGNILWALKSHEQPFLDVVGAESLLARGVRPDISYLDGFPEEVVKLVVDCWNEDPSKRPTAYDAATVIDAQLRELSNIN